jgi:hypothetical protein
LGKLAKGRNSFEGVAQACFGFFANIFFLSKTFFFEDNPIGHPYFVFQKAS